MKCIIRLYGLRGGAPRSVLQHIKVLKRFSYDDIECMARNTDEQLRIEYEDEVNQMIIRTSPEEFCWTMKYKSALLEYLWEYQYIKKKKADLVIALGQINGALYSTICKKLGIPLIVYIPGGEISQHDSCFALMRDCEVVCFSLENADIITKYFSAAHTNVISNRIDIRNRFEDIEKHYTVPNREINVLIVSRIDKGKVDSIYSVLNTLSKCASTDLPINVRIAGAGRCQEDMSEFCNKLQANCLRIQMLGHVHDLTEQFRWAHIVAGKARSVIEPIMMNRIGCIIGEDGKIEFCKKENYENLYHYNFSGRNLRNENSYTEMYEMLQKIRNGQISKELLMENADMTIQNYAAEYLPAKLQQVIKKLPVSIRPNHWASLIYCYIRLVSRLLINSIVYRKE